ncbi:MAG: M55 family metallopeptidase [Burkholderiales bacterium]
MDSQQRPLKVLISVDMEGVTGVVTGDQLGPTGWEYARFREFMTNEALAAVEAARESGATEILVVDAHGNGENLLIERFPADVRIVRSWPRPLMMMEGIDSTFGAVVFVGYHSATTNPRGVRAHTISSATFAAVELNDVPMAESGINAAIAGHFGVPVVAISGDDAAVAEAQLLVPGVEGAVVKRSISFHSASTLTPQAGAALIKEKVKSGLAKRAAIRPYVVRGPLRLDVTFKNYTPAEVATYLPGIQRLNAHTIRFTARDVIEVSRFIQFLTTYQAGLTP